MFRSKFATVYERENDLETNSRWSESLCNVEKKNFKHLHSGITTEIWNDEMQNDRYFGILKFRILK